MGFGVVDSAGGVPPVVVDDKVDFGDIGRCLSECLFGYFAVAIGVVEIEENVVKRTRRWDGIIKVEGVDVGIIMGESEFLDGGSRDGLVGEDEIWLAFGVVFDGLDS